MKRLIAVCVFAMFVSGCIPTIIGAAAYSSSKNKKTRQEFVNNFNQTNIEREKAGLKPLDYCDEALKFDAKWAMKNGCTPFKK